MGLSSHENRPRSQYSLAIKALMRVMSNYPVLADVDSPW